MGDELLSGRTQDVNLYRFSGILGEYGLPVKGAKVVRDSVQDISRSVHELLLPGRILIISGGLGPTDDDLTLKGVAKALEKPLERNPEAEAMVRKKQRQYGLGVPESALKQADIPAGAIPVMNPVGIAPGVVISYSNSAVICVPGVPSESRALIEPCLAAADAIPGRTEAVLFIRTWGLKENDLFDSLKETSEKFGVIPAYLPSPGRVDVKVSGPGAEEFRSAVITKLAGRVYSTKRDETLEEVLGRKLVKSQYLLSVAESCTGGGIGRAVTSVSGSSEWFAGGVISYSNRVKTSLLGVSETVLASWGAVSRETALAMARGVREITGSHCAVAVTGIAGPGGGTDEKPVGTVWTAALTPKGERADLWRIGGNRETVREGAVSRSLGSLLELLG